MDNLIKFLSDNKDLTALIISFGAMLLSFAALIYTIKTFLLKSGHKLRCNFSICSSRECDDKYVHSITIENLKDKAVVIFKIYLKIGNNYYLELEDHSNEPLIIKPFEVYQKTFEPIVYYTVNTNRIILDKLFDDFEVKKKIVLTTTAGKYEVKTNLRPWNPIGLFFKNNFTGIIRSHRIAYEGKCYGSNVKYLVHLKFDDADDKVIAVHEGDDSLVLFKNFNFTKESIKSEENLKKFFSSLKRRKVIKYRSIDIISFNNNIPNLKNLKTIHAPNIGYFKYLILGKIYTILEKKRIDNFNKKNKGKKLVE